MKIAFFIGSVDISGGTYVIYQHAMHAMQAGHDVTMVVLYPYGAEQMGWHPACRELRFIGIDDLDEECFDLAIATWWKTATELHRVDALRYAYFVQSIESRFYPSEEAPLRALVERTYDLGLPTVTEATWIMEYLGSAHGNEPALVRNGIRKDLYTPHGPRLDAEHAGLRVLVEGPFGVHFKNVGTSIRLARKSKCASTWLLTSTAMHRWYPGVERVYSRIPVDQVPSIYRSCDVLVKLSTVEGMFGPPLEMFHCGGTSIVYAVSGHDEYIRDGLNGIVIEPGNESAVVAAIDTLASDPSLLSHLRRGALETAAEWPDWVQSSSLFLSWIESMATCSTPSRTDLEELNQASMAIYVRDENERLSKASPGKSTPLIRRALQSNRIAKGALRHLDLMRESF